MVASRSNRRRVHHLGKILAVDADQDEVISRFEMDPVVPGQAFIENHRKPISSAYRRHRADLAIGKQHVQFLLGHQREIAIKQL